MTKRAIRRIGIVISILVFLASINLYYAIGTENTKEGELDSGTEISGNVVEETKKFQKTKVDDVAEESEKSKNEKIDAKVMAIIFLLAFCLYYISTYIPYMPAVIAPLLSSCITGFFTFKEMDDYSRLCYIVAWISFVSFLFLLNCGFRKNAWLIRFRYTDQLEALMWNNNWVGNKKKIKWRDIKQVRVGLVNTIPKDQDSVSSTKYTSLMKAIRVFGQGAYRKKNNYARMLIIGNFGSGKSFALQKYAYKQAKKLVVIPDESPIYIKLSDFIKEVDDYRDEETKEPLKYMEQLKEKGPHNQKAWDDLIGTIRNIAFSNVATKSDIDCELYKSTFARLEKKKRLLYLFDGFNEVIQSFEENKRAENAQLIYELLCEIAGENRFILTTCTYLNVITNDTIQYINSKERKYNNNKTLIYVIQGVKLKKKDMFDPLEKFFSSSVALFKLRKMQEINKKDTDNGNIHITPYALLEMYANKAVNENNNITISAEDIKECLISTVENNLDKCDDPDSVIDVNNKIVQNTLLFRPHNPDNIEEEGCITCHTLFFEFMLAQYVKEKLKAYNPKDFGDKEKPGLLYTLYVGKGNTRIIHSPHIREAFIMMVTEVFVNNTEMEQCNKLIKQIFDCMKTDKIQDTIQFLLVLSRIKEDIRLLNPNIEVGSFDIKYAYIPLSVVEELQDSTICVRYQIYNLFSDEDEIKNNRIINLLVEEVLKEKWTYTGLQRQIIKKYILEYGELPSLQDSSNADCTACLRCFLKSACEKLQTDKEIEYKSNMSLECKMDKYFIQEYPAELIRLQRNLHKEKKKPIEESKEEQSSIKKAIQLIGKTAKIIRGKEKPSTLALFRIRMWDIRITVIMYLIYLALLGWQIYYFWPNENNLPMFIVKILGFALGISSIYAWINQLWKDSEYYGWALGNFSRDEPIYEVLGNVLNKNSNESTISEHAAKSVNGEDNSVEKDLRKDVKKEESNKNNNEAQKDKKTSETDSEENNLIILGDWIKNRPSVIFLLMSVMSIVYLHCPLMSMGASRGFAILLEYIIAVLLFICNLPLSSYMFYIVHEKKQFSDYKQILKIIGLLFFIVFIVPVSLTSWGALCWGWPMSVIVSCVAAIVFSFMWKYIVNKAKGAKKKATDKRCIQFDLIAFIILFCAPALILQFPFCKGFVQSVFKLDNADLLKHTCSLLAVVLLAFSIYSLLFYTSYIKKMKSKKDDEIILRKIMQEENDDNLYDYYQKLSCTGQIEMLNRLVNRKDKMDNETRKKLKKKAKTVQALDILLDDEI